MMKIIHPHPKKPMPWLLGKEWDDPIYRVRLPDTSLSAEKTMWCMENVPKSDWGKSFGSEVYYFTKLEDATTFRLRWEGYNETSSST